MFLKKTYTFKITDGAQHDNKKTGNNNHEHFYFPCRLQT